MAKKKKKMEFETMQVKLPHVKGLSIVLPVIYILWVAVMYYLLLPALNIHSRGLWLFVLGVILFPLGIIGALVSAARKAEGKSAGKLEKPVNGIFAAVGVIGILFLLLLFYGSKMFHAQAYADILTIEDSDFNSDINTASSVSKIALMDTDSAVLLGNREIGSLSEVVSQYNVSEDYTQIDYQGAPTKVSALEYAGFFKYMGNKENGVPGYITVDPVGQKAQYVPVKEGMIYVPSAYFGKDLRRHIRMNYPDKLFGNLHFEVDEDGNPYYIASVYKYTIGLFGGETVEGAISCDPISGDCQYYDASEVPNWMDDVFDGDLLVEQYNWYGELSNGFMNSIFGKKGCKKCTETVVEDEDGDEESYEANFGYVAKDGDIWIYTGVTSVNDDASNIGFILVNERTSEAHYYSIAGADESSAMAAAEGEVQEKGYRASFPSLINVDGQPTYIMVLKDASGIVKLYGMVNVESYNMVTTAASLDECFAKYRKMTGSDGTENTGNPEEAENSSGDSNSTAGNAQTAAKGKTIPEGETETRSFVISEIQYVEIAGETYVYLAGDDGMVYWQKFSDNEQLIFLHEGDTVTVNGIMDKDNIYWIDTIGIMQ